MEILFYHKTLFYQGNPVFMSLLTILLLGILILSIYYFLLIIKQQKDLLERTKNRINYIKSVGLFALVMGILAQLTNIYSIFSEIEEAGDITPKIVIDALRNSMAPLTYGVFIYLISVLVWLVSAFILKRSLVKKGNI